MDNYKLTFQTWDKLASAYQDKFMQLELYNDTYDIFCRLIEKQNPHILEIGCGPGNITKYLLAHRPDLKIDAIDIAPSMIELAKKNNPSANFIVMDCREIDSLNSNYDAILCGFCMPYLTKEDSEKLIMDASNLLTSGGLFYFSTIEDDYSKSAFETSSDGQHTIFIYYHQENYLTDYLLSNNFEVVEVIRKLYAKTTEIFSTHIIFIARKKQVLI